ncbi:MAG: zinc-ribbon domain-containing protein [Ktedonobacteraceae bacterium]
MQRCQHCGYEFPENARFCGNCGRVPTSGTALDTASPSFASSPDEFASTIATSPWQQGNQTTWEDEVEQRRRGAILPLPIPFGAEGSSAAGQAPMVQGTPSFNSVPTIQGTPTGMAGSAPPSTVAGPTPSSPYVAPSPAQQANFGPQPSSWTNQPMPHYVQPTGTQSYELPEHEHQEKQHHLHHEHRHQSNTYNIGSTTKSTTGGVTKTILIITIGVVIVAIGASAFAFAFRSHIPGLTSIFPATSNTSNNNSTNTTVCGGSTGTPCQGTPSQSSPQANGQSTGNFSFTGDISGTMTNTTFLACGVTQGNTYVMQVDGTLGGTQYKFLIGILSYKGPGSYTSHLTVDLIHSSNNLALGNDGRLPVNVNITNGGKAGTVNSDLVGILSNFQPSQEHVSASWTCA